KPGPEMTPPLSIFPSGVSRMSSADADLFQEIFQREAICYARSWLYLLRATRDDNGGFGYKFVGEGMTAGIGYRHNTFYIVYPIGSRRFQHLMDLCDQIHKNTLRPVVIKKVDPGLYEQLSATRRFSANIDNFTLFEEEAFPEHILQLERLFSPMAGTERLLHPFLKKVRRCETKLWSVQGISWDELECNPGLQKLFGPDPDKYKSYKQILREATSSRKNDSHYCTCFYYDEKGIIQGLYVSETLEKSSMGLYCAVSSKSSPGITEWMDYDFFHQLFQQGIHTLHLGGSETQGVDSYVKKLLPVAPLFPMRPLWTDHNTNLQD
ncbi:MAG TPA: hypothetical protein VFN35_23650, partial [Ktedonobacteraceae bacterium]|nr:hypothetical protein [Ktedonobacteraceae bacterium]